MPELVEVFVMVDRLTKYLKNNILTDISILSGRYKKTLPENYALFKKKLPLKIEYISSKGKFIYIVLENQLSIWITLGLTGDIYMINDDFSRIQYIDGIERSNIHDRVEFEIQDSNSNSNNSSNSKKSKIYFNDMRNFGTIKFAFSKDELNKKLNTLGPDPLREDITLKDFVKRFDKKSLNEKMICMVLLDQKIIAGIGNYLRSEILYYAKIDPFKKIKDFDENDYKNLYNSMNHIISVIYKKEVENIPYTPLIYMQDTTLKGETVKTKIIDGRRIYFTDFKE